MPWILIRKMLTRIQKGMWYICCIYTTTKVLMTSSVE